MQRDAWLDAELGRPASAVADLVGRLRVADAPAERAALRAAFAARVDGLRADIERRHGLTERQAAASTDAGAGIDKQAQRLGQAGRRRPRAGERPGSGGHNGRVARRRPGVPLRGRWRL